MEDEDLRYIFHLKRAFLERPGQGADLADFYALMNTIGYAVETCPALDGEDYKKHVREHLANAMATRRFQAIETRYKLQRSDLWRVADTLLEVLTWPTGTSPFATHVELLNYCTRLTASVAHCVAPILFHEVLSPSDACPSFKLLLEHDLSQQMMAMQIVDLLVNVSEDMESGQHYFPAHMLDKEHRSLLPDTVTFFKALGDRYMRSSSILRDPNISGPCAAKFLQGLTSSYEGLFAKILPS